MSMADVFTSDKFSAITLTRALREIEPIPPLVMNLGIFAEKGIATTVALIEFDKHTVSLIPQTDRGSPGVKNLRNRRRGHYVETAHFRVEDTLKAADIQNKRKFGSETELETVDDKALEILEGMKSKTNLTREFLMLGALTGKIIEPGGVTLYDLYTELGLTQKSVNFALTTATTNVNSKIRECQDAIDDALTGTPSTGQYLALCSSGFFDALISHASIAEAYRYYQSTQNPNRDDVRATGFYHAGTWWYPYNGKGIVRNSNGTTTTKQFIADNEAVMIPLGTDGLFEEYLSPADYLDFANTIGIPEYAWSHYDGKLGVLDLFAETNPLPICNKPMTMVKLVKA